MVTSVTMGRPERILKLASPAKLMSALLNNPDSGSIKLILPVAENSYLSLPSEVMLSSAISNVRRVEGM